MLAETRTVELVSARELLLTDDKVLVIGPCFSLSRKRSSLATFELTAVLVSKVTENRTKLNVSG